MLWDVGLYWWSFGVRGKAYWLSVVDKDGLEAWGDVVSWRWGGMRGCVQYSI